MITELASSLKIITGTLDWSERKFPHRRQLMTAGKTGDVFLYSATT